MENSLIPFFPTLKDSLKDCCSVLLNVSNVAFFPYLFLSKFNSPKLPNKSPKFFNCE
nr:MAG TPA: hypothetical protein [Caudoviricetes sp.]